MARNRYEAESFPLMVMMGVGCLAFAGTLGADAFYHEVGGLCNESIGQLNCWNRDILKAECAVARLAVKMHVTVIIYFTVSVAEFVSDALAAVINLVQQMVLVEKGQSAEYARLVNGVNLILQLSHSDGALTISQRL
jgi:fumarate reductase subunit D